MDLVRGIPLWPYCAAIREGVSPGDDVDASASDHDEEAGSQRGEQGEDSRLTRGSATESITAEPYPISSSARLPEPSSHASAPPVSRAALHDLLTVVRRLCAPLACLHGEGIVHRDLKPANVLITPEGIPVLVDFGLATQFEGRLTLGTVQSSGLTEGTLSYMAPEGLSAPGITFRSKCPIK